MTSLATQLTYITESSFEALSLPLKHARVQVSAPEQPSQFQCNGAMACAKIVGKNPRDIAQDIVQEMEKHPEAHTIFQNLEIAGPGFINIILHDAYIGQYAQNISESDQFGIDLEERENKVVLDYGGPNIAKNMHVGHLRSAIIGDSLRRICNYKGAVAIGDVHMGDWGTPMGMILSELEVMNFDGDVTMEMLAEIYPKASTDCKENPARMEVAREATKKLQEGHEAYTKKWRSFIDVSIEGMKKNFEALGVHFDEWKGESDAHPYIADMIEDLKKQGLAEESDGALIINVSQKDDKKEVPPLILLKSDGAVLYSTTDLATIIDRMKSHGPEKIIYVVDKRQSLHFEQVFRAARMSGIAPEDKTDLVFAGFGTMNGSDGKPFKTRAGGVMKLEDLIAMGIEKAEKRLQEAALAEDMNDKERADVAHKVAIAAIKFADLQNNRSADYVFDLDRMTSFEGKTGPYMLYQAVRIKSLLRKAGIKEDLSSVELKIEEADRDLALLLCEFPDHFVQTLKLYAPHILCEHAYKLAQAFSSFYGNCHILSEEDEALKHSRLALCQHTYRQLETLLDLLGIQIPDRM